MRRLAAVIVTALLAASAVKADPAKRDRLEGFNGVAFGTTFAAAKAQLGSGAKADVDSSDTKVKILLARTNLFGENFAVNYTFADKGRFSEAYAVGNLPTGDQSICQTRWIAVREQIEKAWGKPDSKDNELSRAIPSQTIAFNFGDGSLIEASLMGCLLTLIVLSPAEAK